MRLGFRCLLLLVCLVSSAFGQGSSAAPFTAQLVTKFPSLLNSHSLTLDGDAEWIAGATRESGAAHIQVSSDGSSSIQLNLATASRTETRTALGTSRTCQWTDADGTTHSIAAQDCDQAVSWVAPLLLAHPLTVIETLLIISDEGQVSRDGTLLRKIRYSTSEPGKDATSTNGLTADTSVSVLYDPQTLLPASVEYVQHLDRDLLHGMNVRVTYSDYQSVSGIPVPMKIDRYVNNVLQLSISIHKVSLN